MIPPQEPQAAWSYGCEAPTHGHSRRLSRSKGVVFSRGNIDSTVCCSGDPGDNRAYNPSRHQDHHRHSGRAKVLMNVSLVGGLMLGCRYLFFRPVTTVGETGSTRSSTFSTTLLAEHIVQNIPWEEDTRRISDNGSGSNFVVEKKRTKTPSTGNSFWDWAHGAHKIEEIVYANHSQERHTLRVDVVENGTEGGGERRRTGGVPDWARPSEEEMENIIRAQFGEWRTIQDAQARGSTTTYKVEAESVTSPSEGLLQPGQRGSKAGEAVHEAETGDSGAHQGELKGSCPAMKQGMAPFPEDVVRRCYDDMRKGFLFGEPLRQVEVITKGGDKPVKDSPLGVVTYMSTSRKDDIESLTTSLQKLSESFLREHRYPVAIVHEDFTEGLVNRLSGMVPVPMFFVKVAFKLPDWMEPLSWIYPLAVKHFTGHPKSKPIVGYHSEMRGLLPYVKRKSFGYFHMCRFFGGAGFLLPFFDQFEYYLRLDSDSVCKKDLPDYFSALEDAGADYIFDTTFLDHGEKTQGLWNFGEAYMREHEISPTFWNSTYEEGRRFPALPLAKVRPSYPQCGDQAGESRVDVALGTKVHSVPCRDRHFQAVPAFYTNFEVARIQMLRSSWYQNWFNAIDKTGSIFYNRWGDAPIRFLGLAMHLPANKVLRMRGCQHD